jgi:hypothetical protein
VLGDICHHFYLHLFIAFSEPLPRDVFLDRLDGLLVERIGRRNPVRPQLIIVLSLELLANQQQRIHRLQDFFIELVVFRVRLNQDHIDHNQEKLREPVVVLNVLCEGVRFCRNFGLEGLDSGLDISKRDKKLVEKNPGENRP